MSVVIDTREFSKHQKIAKYLRERGISVSVETLQVGDYLIRGKHRNFLIERKSIFDLLNSVKSGRLWDQLKRMKSVEEAEPIIIVESSPAFAARKTKWNEMSIASIINSILLDWNVKIVFSPSIRWTVLNILSLTKFTEQEPSIHKLRFEKKPIDIKQAIRFVVEGIPLIGPVYADKLLRKFRRIKSLANASLDEILSVEGIGETKARFIFRVMNEEYE